MYYSIACDGSCENFLIAGDNLLYGLSVADPDNVVLYYNATLTAGSEAYFQAVVASQNFDILAGAPYNTEDGDNLILSTDGGATWTQSSSPSTSWWALDMNLAGNVIGATDAASNVYLSYNNGSSWTLISTPQGTSEFIGGIVVSEDGEFASIAGSFIYIESFAPTVSPTAMPSTTAAPSYRKHGGADDGDDSDLTGGEVAGAVIGALLGAALLGVAAFVAYNSLAGKTTLNKPLLDVNARKESKEMNAVL